MLSGLSISARTSCIRRWPRWIAVGEHRDRPLILAADQELGIGAQRAAVVAEPVFSGLVAHAEAEAIMARRSLGSGGRALDLGRGEGGRSGWREEFVRQQGDGETAHVVGCAEQAARGGAIAIDRTRGGMQRPVSARLTSRRRMSRRTDQHHACARLTGSVGLAGARPSSDMDRLRRIGRARASWDRTRSSPRRVSTAVSDRGRCCSCLRV